jgi:hypothetical protein
LTFDQVNEANGYEISCRLSNETAYSAKTMPHVFMELVLRTGEAYEVETIALLEFLLEIRSSWAELGFMGSSSYSFSEEEAERHRQQLMNIRNGIECGKWSGTRYALMRRDECPWSWISTRFEAEA